MACAASTGTVHPVPVKDASESLLRVDNEPETGKGDMHINRPWGKLMVGFLIAKLDQMVQQALAGLERDDCELFASSEYSDQRIQVHQQFQVHQKFLALLEDQLEASLGCVGISTAEVVEGLQQEADANSEARAILEQLLLYTELPDFAMIMRRRSCPSTGTVHVQPVPVEDARESTLRVDSEPETGKGDVVSINRKLMVGFLIAKLDQMVQQALAGLERDDCEIFASSEYSDQHIQVHQQFQVHQKFLALLDHELEASLGCVGISTAEVVEGLQQEADANSEARAILEQLLLYTELPDFAMIMRRRSWGRVSEVRLYWDIENVPGEGLDEDSTQMIRTLMAFLKDNYMLSGNVDMWAVAPSHYFSKKQTMVRDLNEFGIVVVNCSDKAESADHLIKRRVERDLAVMRKLEVPPQETAFILITSDKDFMDILRDLFCNGHKTVLIHNAKQPGGKRSEHLEKVTFFSTENFVFDDIVCSEQKHDRNAWQTLMHWANNMVQPGVRIKHSKEQTLQEGVSMWRCTLDVEFDKKNCFFLAEGMHSDKRKCGEESAKRGLMRLQELPGCGAEELVEQHTLKRLLKPR